eukprot:TRINITY_DN11582_c0_g1_i1.p1 TRINITY_DN11582_c0_g1~~TRINITY_DN11582_c0_g1_i1.p1  ORF type:complete len:150 (+),score=26.11 TRINITY_DN11582_c0_g1_i1:56-505(+)
MSISAPVADETIKENTAISKLKEEIKNTTSQLAGVQEKNRILSKKLAKHEKKTRKLEIELNGQPLEVEAAKPTTDTSRPRKQSGTQVLNPAVGAITDKDLEKLSQAELIAKIKELDTKSRIVSAEVSSGGTQIQELLGKIRDATNRQKK